MRSILPSFLLVLLIGSLLVQPDVARAEKSYRVDSLVIEASAQADGSLKVVEERAFRFRGRYKYAYRTFSRSDGVDYSGFVVSENGRPYARNDSQAPGTYRISENGGVIEVRWFFKASNETRTFTISYQVENLIRRHPDAAVLHYQFVGSGFAVASSNVSLSVHPPQELASAQVHQWLHGPLWAESVTNSGGVIKAWCDRLPAHQFLELRVLYPPDAFPDAPAASEPIVERVMEEEAVLAKAANQRRIEARARAERRAERMKLGRAVTPVLGLLGVFAWVLVFLRYGRRAETPTRSNRSGEIPSDLPPALTQYLVANRMVNANGLVATFLDLASRGFVEFHEDSELRTYILGISRTVNKHYWVLLRKHYESHRSDLLPFETMLISFVFDDLASGDRAPMDLFRKNRTKCRRFFGKWKKAVEEEGQRRGFYAAESYTGRNIGMMVGGLLIAVAIPLGFVFFEWALVPGILGLVLFVLSLAIVHHTRQGAIEAARWKSLKNYLKDLGSKHASYLDSVERYLVYGVALGVGKKALTDLGDAIPVGQHQGYVPWYYVQGGHGGTFGASFGAAFSASVATVSSSMSSATGAGGGASGGGGGAGGGGGGAG